MERSRSKRSYYYDQDYDSETLGRTKPRYNNHHHHYAPGPGAGHRYRGGAGGGHRQDPSLTVNTNYRILCHDMKAGGVIGKAGSIIKNIRQHTGAWINVHELAAGDSERIIEISDTRRRDPEGRMPNFSPAQEALLLIHERILECDGGYSGGGYGEDGGGGGGGRAVTRLVVSRAHVGSLLGKGGKIIEQMRMETKTQIRVLPRDQTLPRCVSMADEIVQVVGDVNNVKNALAIISSRLRESQHRDRSHFHGRVHSPDRFYPPEDDFIPHGGNPAHRSSIEGNNFGSRSGSVNTRSNNNVSRPSGFLVEADSTAMAENTQPFEGEELIFRILCPIAKIDSVVNQTDGIIDLLQNEVGVDVKISDPVAGSDEQVITISSEEDPDDELFPAQEALLHIQTHIVDLFPDKENIITTRLLVPSRDVGCLEGKDGSFSHIKKQTGANVQILPREQLPTCVFGAHELVQIVGEVKAAREALVEVTSRLKIHLYGEFFKNDSPSPVASAAGSEAISPNKVTPVLGVQAAPNTSTPTYESIQNVPGAQPSHDNGGPGTESSKRTEGDHREEVASGLSSRIAVPLVTRSILEVVIPEHAVPKLITKSRNMLSQISKLSSANVTLLEDRPDVTEKIIQISGTPEQAERAQSLLQGFILSTLEDGP